MKGECRGNAENGDGAGLRFKKIQGDGQLFVCHLLNTVINKNCCYQRILSKHLEHSRRRINIYWILLGSENTIVKGMRHTSTCSVTFR